MDRLRPIRYNELVKKIQRAGYTPIRKSKHIIYFHPQKLITIPIPHKHSRNVPIGLLEKIVKEMKISKEVFNKL